MDIPMRLYAGQKGERIKFLAWIIWGTRAYSIKKCSWLRLITIVLHFCYRRELSGHTCSNLYKLELSGWVRAQRLLDFTELSAL